MRSALLLVVALAWVPVPAGAASRTKIAVTDIKNVQGVSPGTATILSDIVVSEVARAGYDVVSQADIVAMIGFEKQKKMLGCSSDDSSCLAEIGGALGVDYMLAGQVGQIGSRYRISLMAVDSKRARVVSRAAQFSDPDEDRLVRAAEGVLKEVLAGIRAAESPSASRQQPPPPATVAPPPPRAAEPPPPSKVAAAAPRADLSARPSAPPPIPPAAPGDSGPGFRPSRTLAYVTLGAGVALLGGGAVFGMKAKAERDDLAKAWAQPNYASVYDTKSKAAKSAALLSNVCWVSGAAATGLGGWFLWKSRTPTLAVAPAIAEDGRLALVAGGSF